MKKKLIYTCTLFSCLLFLMGCADDLVSGIFRGDGVQLTINLNVPGESSAATRAIKTRVGGSNVFDNELDSATYYQRFIADDDLYILVFENTGSGSTEEWKLLAVPTITSISGYNGDETREITAMMSRVSGSKTLLVDVVANIVENGAMNGSTSIDFNTMIGQSREDIYDAIGTFAYPTNDQDNPYGVWRLATTDAGGTTTHRYLPMWGQSSTATTGGRMTYEVNSNTTELEVHCGLYRSVAKMGLMVDNDCDTFEPTELYVYYINNEGTFVSLPVENTNWSPTISVQYTLPEVPPTGTSTSTNSQRAIEYPLVYKFDKLSAGGSYFNNIYVTEADNITGSTPVCLVVGGYYTGGQYNGEGLVDGTSETDKYTLNYYRIDLESLTTSSEGTTTSGAFDVIRNHSYLFNIKNANNPGTSDPDPRSAASGLEVEILDYTEVPMHGINTQYTLTVNKSLFSFEGATTSVGELLVSTDGGVEWTLVTDWEEMTDPNGNAVEGGTLPDWAHVYDPETHTNSNDTVYIAVDANVNNEILRNGSFWIKAGDVIKKIDLVQDYTETANSYIITAEGTYDAKVNIRGNGNTQAWTDDTGNAKEAIDFNMTDSISDVFQLKIIWETSEGLVTIPENQTLSESGCLSYTVHDVNDEWGQSVFASGHGGNALIGVYNSVPELVWSIHVWVCADYANGVLTEDWVVGTSNSESDLTTYSYMDRNLGAYSNLPGKEASRAFGLLYQWGRKDPFIGAKRDANATTNTGERDYHQVPKQKTYHYEQPNDTTYLWSNYDDSQITSANESQDVLFTIKHPTTLLEDGLLSGDHYGDQAKGLWGTTSYTYDDAELGNKTMYDPCPAGYRVPSLNALTIWDGTNNMWYNGQPQHSSNSCRYVPVKEDDDFRTGNGYSASFVSDAPFYGFWLDYANGYGFNTMYTSNQYGVNYYNEGNLSDGSYGWITNFVDSKPPTVTWIPLAGIYNGSMDHFGRAGITDRGPGGSEPYLPASSLQVTSVLWANSPTSGTNTNYPGGLLIHGTEGAYAPHYTTTTQGPQGGTTTSSFYYSPGEYESASSVTANTVATEGEGYWHTGTTAYSTSPAGWWTGSVDWQSSSTYGSTQGTWNYTNNSYSGIFDNNYNSSVWYDEDGFDQSGRHFHSYQESNASVYANPSYAASVRCIRDKDAIVHKDDKLYYQDESGNWTEATTDNSVTLYLYDYESSSGGQTVKDVITLAISYVEEWEVTYPGAKWISINPTSGSTTDPSGSADAIEITYGDEKYMPSSTDSEADRTAIITITTARGTTFTITVVYVGGTRGQN